jgi:hypothetical protein
MVVTHPKRVESGADPEPLFRRHATDLGAFDFFGFRVIREDSNGPVHGLKLAQLDAAYRVAAHSSGSSRFASLVPAKPLRGVRSPPAT